MGGHPREGIDLAQDRQELLVPEAPHAQLLQRLRQWKLVRKEELQQALVAQLRHLRRRG